MTTALVIKGGYLSSKLRHQLHGFAPLRLLSIGWRYQPYLQ